MSFATALLPELQSLVLAYLIPQHLLSTASHLCHSITRSALTTACFRTHLVLDDRTINALSTLSPFAFSCLNQARSIHVRYGNVAEERQCRVLFSALSDRSLLRFIHTRTLSFAYTDTWDFLNHATPLMLLQQLLDQYQHSHSSTSISTGEPPLPRLTSLTLHGVPDYDGGDMLVSLVHLRSLRHLHLFFTHLHRPQLLTLLELPELHEVVCSNYQRFSTPKKAMSDEAAVHAAFEARAVQLTWLVGIRPE